MMATGYDTSGLMPGSYNYIRAHFDELAALPPPEDRWTWHDITTGVRRHWKQLRADGAIEIVDRDGDGNVVCRTTRQAWQVVEECRETRDTLLCGHTGLKNIGDGLYTCGCRDCTHKYTRDTMELLLDS